MVVISVKYEHEYIAMFYLIKTPIHSCAKCIRQRYTWLDKFMDKRCTYIKISILCTLNARQLKAFNYGVVLNQIVFFLFSNNKETVIHCKF